MTGLAPPGADITPGRWWHRLDDGRIQCDLCPRDCRLHEGQRGLCFVRQRIGDAMLLTTYGRSSGFCVDPIEKKPLNHFYPGSSVFSFGTAGCNLACKFCQNWDLSKSREMDRLMDSASPERIAEAARDSGCASVAFSLAAPGERFRAEPRHRPIPRGNLQARSRAASVQARRLRRRGAYRRAGQRVATSILRFLRIGHDAFRITGCWGHGARARRSAQVAQPPEQLPQRRVPRARGRRRGPHQLS